MSAILEVEDLHVAYGDTKVLHGIGFSVEMRGITTILGANGAGKTTTLRAVSGIVPPRGRVALDGRRIDGKACEDIARLGIAHVPEGRGTFVGFTVEENLRLGGYALTERKAVRDRTDEILDLFPRLRERRRQLAGTLSGGEQRLLELGRALIVNPKVLLLDEPSAMLAPAILEGLFEEIRRIAERGTTILLVEQNIRKAFEITDFVYVLDYGTNFYEGTPQQCSGNPALASLFLG